MVDLIIYKFEEIWEGLLIILGQSVSAFYVWAFWRILGWRFLQGLPEVFRAPSFFEVFAVCFFITMIFKVFRKGV